MDEKEILEIGNWFVNQIGAEQVDLLRKHLGFIKANPTNDNNEVRITFTAKLLAGVSNVV